VHDDIRSPKSLDKITTAFDRGRAKLNETHTMQSKSGSSHKKGLAR